MTTVAIVSLSVSLLGLHSSQVGPADFGTVFAASSVALCSGQVMSDGQLSLFNATVTEEKSLSWESRACQSWVILAKYTFLGHLFTHFGLHYLIIIIVPKMVYY
jgi:hypothetical protein